MTSAFARYAAERGLSTWQPKQLEEIAWSFLLDGATRRIEILDRCANRAWSAGDLAGIWYQSMPRLAFESKLEERDRRYVAAEVNAAARPLWHEAACFVIGQPPQETPRELFDFGLESRVHLRRLGLPALTDRIGTLASLRDELKGAPADLVRISRTDGSTSVWLSDLIAEPGSTDSAPGELLAATVTDSRPARVAMHVDDEILIVEVAQDGSLHLVSNDEEIEEIERRVREVTATRMGVTYFGHEAGGWKIARLSLQVPYWLADIVEPWLFPRLFDLFRSGTPAHSAAGLIR